jgi:hypothetical protein
MIHQIHKNIYIYKLESGINSNEFSSYDIRYLTFRTRLSENILKNENGKSLPEKLEGKIIIKTWKELPEKFPRCKIGEYILRHASFSGILMIDKTVISAHREKVYYKILTYFKNRSTVLINRLHGTHGSIFWHNSFEDISIDDNEKFNEVLSRLSKGK